MNSIEFNKLISSLIFISKRTSNYILIDGLRGISTGFRDLFTITFESGECSILTEYSDTFFIKNRKIQKNRKYMSLTFLYNNFFKIGTVYALETVENQRHDLLRFQDLNVTDLYKQMKVLIARKLLKDI